MLPSRSYPPPTNFALSSSDRAPVRAGISSNPVFRRLRSLPRTLDFSTSSSRIAATLPGYDNEQPLLSPKLITSKAPKHFVRNGESFEGEIVRVY